MMKKMTSIAAVLVSVVLAGNAVAGTVNEKVGANGVAYDLQQNVAPAVQQQAGGFPDALFLSDS